MATYEMIDLLDRLTELDAKNQRLKEAKDAVCKHCGCHFDRPDPDCNCSHDGADPSDDCWVTPEAYKSMNEAKKKMVKDPKTGKMVPDYAIDGKGKDDLKKENIKESITISADSPDDLPALQRILSLAGMEPVTPNMMSQGDAPDMTMKNDGDINANDDCGCEDDQQEGFKEGQYDGKSREELLKMKDDAEASMKKYKSTGNDPQSRFYDETQMMMAQQHLDSINDALKKVSQEEGFANSMGNEKDEESFMDDELEDIYGHKPIKKLPRTNALRGDNALESIEAEIKEAYEDFKKKD
jgi:hypothetical protein